MQRQWVLQSGCGAAQQRRKAQQVIIKAAATKEHPFDDNDPTFLSGLEF